MAISVDPLNTENESRIKKLVGVDSPAIRALKNFEIMNHAAHSALALEIEAEKAFRNFFHEQQISKFYINQIELFKKYSPLENVAQRAAADFSRFFNSSHQNLVESAIGSYNGVMNDLLLPETNATLRIFREISENHFLATSQACQSFLNGTLEQLHSTNNDTVKKALHASVYLFEQQLSASRDFLLKIHATPAAVESPFIPSKLNVPIIQQRDLLSAEAIDDDYDQSDLIQLSPAAQTEKISRKILLLVTECNETAKVVGLREIFRPTTRILGTFACFPWLLPVDKQSFGDFIDSLYLVFYEGAGSDKLRFLKEHGGVLEVNECDFIWIIKSLRNKWLRHDPDHGDESNIRKSWVELGETLRRLGLRRVPITEAEFRRVHRQLLKRAIVFVKKLSDQLTDRDR